MRRSLVGLLFVTTLVVAGGAAPAAAQATSLVTVVHAVRGLVADVYVDGQVALPGFEPDRVTEPIAIPAGPHDLEVREAGAAATSAPLAAAHVEVPGGMNLSVVAHLAADGSPTISAYVNDVSSVPPGQSRLVVRNQAAGGPVDVLFDGQPFAAGLANAQEFAGVVPASPHEITVMADDGSVVVPATAVELTPGTAQLYYLAGSADDGTVTWLVQTLGALGAAPTGVATGGGPVESRPWLSPLWAAAATAAIGGTWVLAERGQAAPARDVIDRWSRRALVVAVVLVSSLWGATTLSRTAAEPPDLQRPTPIGSIPSIARAQPPPSLPPAGPTTVPSISSTTVPSIASHSALLEDQPAPAVRVPVALRIEQVGVAAWVVAVGADPSTGQVELPPDPSIVLWYQFGPAPGDPGSAVLAGHVNWGGEPGVFARLAELVPGSTVTVTYADGLEKVFAVTGLRSYAKASLPVAYLFNQVGDPMLVLITCGGAFDASKHSYEDNVVVWAQPVAPPTTRRVSAAARAHVK